MKNGRFFGNPRDSQKKKRGTGSTRDKKICKLYIESFYKHYRTPPNSLWLSLTNIFKLEQNRKFRDFGDFRMQFWHFLVAFDSLFCEVTTTPQRTDRKKSRSKILFEKNHK